MRLPSNARRAPCHCRVTLSPTRRTCLSRSWSRKSSASKSRRVQANGRHIQLAIAARQLAFEASNSELNISWNRPHIGSPTSSLMSGESLGTQSPFVYARLALRSHASNVSKAFPPRPLAPLEQGTMLTRVSEMKHKIKHHIARGATRRPTFHPAHCESMSAARTTVQRRRCMDAALSMHIYLSVMCSIPWQLFADEKTR